jgi:hypothetical protein
VCGWCGCEAKVKDGSRSVQESIGEQQRDPVGVSCVPCCACDVVLRSNARCRKGQRVQVESS